MTIRPMTVTFPGGRKVQADFEGHCVTTDQPEHVGGDDTAPTPLDFFFISLGACAGYYVLSFLLARDLPIEGASLEMDTHWNDDEKRVERFDIRIQTPEGFPVKYVKAIERAVGSCTVERALKDPPEITVSVTEKA